MSNPHFSFQLAIDHSEGWDAANGTLGTAALLHYMSDLLNGPEPGEGPWNFTDTYGNKCKARYTSSFTVVGFYSDTRQVFADHVVADDAESAMGKVARERFKDGSDCQIIGAIPGEHQLDVAYSGATENTGKSAYASDLAASEA